MNGQTRFFFQELERGHVPHVAPRLYIVCPVCDGAGELRDSDDRYGIDCPECECSGRIDEMERKYG